MRIIHLAGGRITSAICRSAVNRALSSAVKTPAGLRILFLCPNPHLMNSKVRTTLNQRAIRIKNARRTISGRHNQ
jgi:hypothetical protein